MTFEEIKNMPKSEWRAYLGTLPMMELLKLAEEGTRDVADQVDAIGKSLKENFERQLESDGLTRQEIDEVIAKLEAKA